MRGRHIQYLAVLTGPLSVWISLRFGGWASYTAVLYAFGLIPFLELFLSGSDENMSKAEEAVAKQDRLYDYLLYLMVPVQYGLLLFFLFRIGNPGLQPYEVTGMILAFGISCSLLGTNVAHELGHRHKPFERFLAKSLLLTSLLMHFIIQHNRGHHRRVSTPGDADSARYRENVYLFWLRSSAQGYAEAWRLENSRVKKVGISAFSLRNEMLRFTLIQLALLGVIGVLFGITVMLAFIAAAAVGHLLLGTINYIEHYGLQRKLSGETYEKVTPAHSWNSNHSMGRILLFELTRHSDHHYQASRKYQILRHHDQSPQMPTGYPGMMLLSLLPPLFFAVMHRQIRHFKATPAGAALA